MATAAASIRILDTEKIIDFNTEALSAPFPLRCAALIIDYMVLLLMPVVWLVLARFLSDTGVPDAIGKTIWTLAGLLFVVDCILLPIIFRGQSLGKMLVGIRIVKRDGTRAHALKIILRDVLGYFLTALTFGLGFLVAAVNPSGRALHDYVAGTIVIRGRKRPA
ncbi:MAG: RDD family protein [Acidobacteria bacterium]|nr:RDD family protein [Acidobacteriota bacterium]